MFFQDINFGVDMRDCIQNKILVHDFIYLHKKDIPPHEWLFIQFLKEEIRMNPNLSSIFVLFVLRYYPNYSWSLFNQQNYLSTVLIELSLRDYQFQQVYNFGVANKDILDNALEFGNIVTDFLIRVCNYSLIKTCNQKIILTARNDCDKFFEKYLLEGFHLQHLSRYVFDGIVSNDMSFGHFSIFPPIPTRETWFSNLEMVEVDNSFQPVLKR